MKQTNNYPKYESCIKACLRCADACNHCASSCTQEKDIKMMARCIQLDMICYASAQLMSLGSEMAKAVCQICADICWQCNEECSKHQTDHCQECAMMCKLCAEECQKMAA